MTESSKTPGKSSLNLLIALVLSVLFLMINWANFPIVTGDYPTTPEYTDPHWYRELAQGNIEHVPRPFSSRILLPLAVRAVAATGYLNTDEAFFAIGIFVLFALVFVVTTLTAPLTAYPILPIVLLFTPFFIRLSAAYYMVDLFHAALIALFLWLLPARLLITGLMLFVLFLARESTILLALSLIFVACLRRQIGLAVTAVLVSVAGMASIVAIGAAGLPDMHALGVLYLPLKVLFNFAWNIAGLEFYTNTFANCDPVWTVELPAVLPLGRIDTVGVCRIDFMRPQQTVLNLLALFGVAPTLALVAVLRDKRQNLLKYPLAWSVALLYGFAAFLLGTTLGSPNWRIMGYGWPAFWIATPLILANSSRLTGQNLSVLIGCHVVASWTPEILTMISSARVYALPVFLGVVSFLVLIHYLSFTVVRHSSPVPGTFDASETKPNSHRPP